MRQKLTISNITQEPKHGCRNIISKSTVATTTVTDSVMNWSQSEVTPPRLVVPDPEPAESESVFSRCESPTKLGEKAEFGDMIKLTTWELAQEFSSTSELLSGMFNAKVPRGKITLLVIEAISARAKSQTAMKNIINRVSGLVLFYLELRQETEVELTGPQSVVLLRDYLESLAERGRTVPAAGKHALSAWADALGIDWPLTNALVTAASVVESNETPKQAPAMTLNTVRALEEMALDTLVSPYKRAFAAGILLMTFASLRFSDAQRLRSFGINEDSVYGPLLACKTKKQHGQFWPWACPRQGLTGSRDWVQPLIDMRAAFRKVNGDEPSFTFMKVDQNWQVLAAEAAPYSTTRRRLALVCVALGDKDGDTYTLHSPKNLFPTAANQLSFDQRELNIIGHWSSTSRMPGHAMPRRALVSMGSRHLGLLGLKPSDCYPLTFFDSPFAFSARERFRPRKPD